MLRLTLCSKSPVIILNQTAGTIACNLKEGKKTLLFEWKCYILQSLFPYGLHGLFKQRLQKPLTWQMGWFPGNQGSRNLGDLPKNILWKLRFKTRSFRGQGSCAATKVCAKLARQGIRIMPINSRHATARNRVS